MDFPHVVVARLYEHIERIEIEATATKTRCRLSSINPTQAASLAAGRS